MNEKFLLRRDFFRWAKEKYPRREQPEAAWARSLESSWRLRCARTGQDPAATGDKRRAAPATAAEAEEAARFREEARRQAVAAKCMGSPFPEAELEAAWLAVCHDRAPDGLRFEE